MSFFRTNKKTTETPKETQKRIESLEKNIQELSKELGEFKQGMRKAVTKIGVVRFNPFKETGSDQSFAIALLDQDNNGFVVTSHYLKEYNRVYGKPVMQGESQYSLSEEEKEAITKAMTNDK